MFIKAILVLIMVTGLSSFSYGQTVVSRFSVVLTEVSIPLDLNKNCTPALLIPHEIQLVCTFDLGYEPKSPFTYDVKPSGDMYFEHEYEIKGQNLIVYFINPAWVDDADFEDGDELRFQSEVLSYFLNVEINLLVSITGPE